MALAQVSAMSRDMSVSDLLIANRPESDSLSLKNPTD
jgi:hypothetical protein